MTIQSKTGAPDPCWDRATAVDRQFGDNLPIVLVGLMGAGKTSVGRRLATALAIPFTDSDERVAEAAAMSITDIFNIYGEAEFRDVERRVIARLLDDGPAVIAYGGGAFIDAQTRKLTQKRAFSIWLRTTVDTLIERTERKKGTRPLLDAGDPKQILHNLSAERSPVYALADLTVDTDDHNAQALADEIARRLTVFMGDGGT